MRPEAEVSIDADLVRRLLVEQCPDLAEEELRPVGEGWDNASFRVGSRFVVRLPRRSDAVPLLVKEQRWLPLVAERLTSAVPRPVHCGVASALFPWPWSVVEWIDGVTADRVPLRADEATHLATELRSLHQEVPGSAPANPFRGVPLRERSGALETRLERLTGLPSGDVRRLNELWRVGREAEPASVETWIHGDLHPRNVLTLDGRLVGIIDWGDMAKGDPATDLAAAWMLLPGHRHPGFWDDYGVDPNVVARARAWAIFFGVTLATSGELRHEQIGRKTLDRTLGSASAGRPDALRWRRP